MAWLICKKSHICKECKLFISPGEKAWKEPRRFGLIGWGLRRTVDKGGIHCEECGRILEYER